ncbi:MAG: hypothetical protein VKL59_07735 [Nostocaceae cyanobacterium]|nr:hypothetical protein [Nostocaceae cyanobacterium]
MKPLISSPTAVALTALLAAITLSSCGNKQATQPDTSTTTPEALATTQPVAPTTQGVAPQGTSCPSDNPIKGVTSKRLGKIALTSKSPEYNKVTPDKCFPDTAAAQSAGYAVPK